METTVALPSTNSRTAPTSAERTPWLSGAGKGREASLAGADGRGVSCRRAGAATGRGADAAMRTVS